MRDDFCVLILTHGRPDRVHTYTTLRKAGYTGKIYIVIDDEDNTESEYRKRYGAEVLQFSKAEIAKTFDEGDNFDDRRAIIYARNACWDLAKQVGCRYFIQLDDDYTAFYYKFDENRVYNPKTIRSLDIVLEKLLDYYIAISAKTIAIGQQGDFIGGSESTTGGCVIRTKRKAMNSFICSVDRKFNFVGRINEDVNTYVSKGRSGELFISIMSLSLNQLQTQSNKGGMSELYLDTGTYLKSFYSVMYAPSCVKVTEMDKASHKRLHHKINWNATSPKILREIHKKRAMPA